MRWAISRRTAYVLGSVALVGGSLQLVGGSQLHSRSASVLLAPATPASGPLSEGSSTRPQRRPGDLTPAAAKLLFALANRTSDASNADDLFAAKSWYVAPAPPPPAPAAAPVAPTAPPLPYVFVGSYSDGDQPTVYFLTRGDRVYDVKVGDTLDAIYSVDGVQNGALVFTYKPLDTRQTLEMGGGT